jgi:hypothetical protein
LVLQRGFRASLFCFWGVGVAAWDREIVELIAEMGRSVLRPYISQLECRLEAGTTKS